MVVETLLGTALGGLLRLVPEGLRFWSDTKDKAHELAMAELNLRTMELQAKNQMDFRRLDGDIQLAAADIQALVEGNKAQASMMLNTGVRWLDAGINALNASMRPVMVYYYMLMYAAVKAAVFYTYLGDGVDWAASMKLLWNAEDAAVWASIASFVFLDRTLRKGK
jgi:hypothetical protein